MIDEGNMVAVSVVCAIISVVSLLIVWALVSEVRGMSDKIDKAVKTYLKAKGGDCDRKS